MEKIISPITGKSKYLLIENCEVISDIKISQDLKESLKLSAGKAGTLIVKNLPGTILNRENQNGRIYTTEVLAQAIREARPLFETKQLICSAHEHPEGSFVAPTDAAHVVTNAYIKKNVNVVVDGERGTYDMLFLDIEVLNTVEGKNLRALLEAECSIGTSIRGVGDMEGKYVKNYEFLGVDFVGNPSSSTFTRMPVSESVKVEMKDPREMKETFTVTTSSTNVVRDLDQAAMLQQQLDGLGYGTVTKTSTKLDQETDPKTGAQTSIATLEAETSDDVADLDQALQMARNAMLNGTINVDSITIENIPEEGETKEAVEATCEYVPEKTTLKEKPVNEDIIKNQDIGFFIDGKFVPMFHAGKDGHLTSLHSKGNKKVMKKEEAITEAKKEDDEDPNLGKKFVLHTDRGFVTFDKNAIDFTQKPEDALHFTEGKEESGMVSMSKVTEILDAMGIFDVEKYFQKNDINLGMQEPETEVKEPTKECGTNCGGSQMTEENGSNTKYMAQITINDQNGSNNETVPVSAVDLDSAKNEIANLYDMKAKTLNGQGTINVVLIDTITGEQLHYNPESQLLESGEDKEEKAICSKCEKEFPLKDMQAVNNSDELLCPQCYDATFDSSPFEEEYNEADFEDPVICSWCKDMFEKADCKKEKDMGWLCDQCQRALESRGVELEFEDEVIEEMTSDNDIQVNGNKVTTKVDDDITIEKDFDSPIQAQVATAAVAQGKADPKILVPEASEELNNDGGITYNCDSATYDYKTGDFTCEDTQKEKLYSNPSEPSDDYEKEPLTDATEDLLVTLKDIDWDMEAIINSLDDDVDIEEVIEALPDPWTIRVNAVEIDNVNTIEELKAAILKAANEQAPWAIKNAVLDHVDEVNTGLGVYDKATAEAPIVPDYYVD